MLSEAQRETLAKELHAAIDSALARHVGADPEDVVSVVPQGDGWRSWKYRWPDGKIEVYDRTWWFTVAGPAGEYRALVGKTVRGAWGKARGRYVVFGQVGREDSSTFYPWTEFVESDLDSYSATLPDPSRPRSSLKDGAVLPARVRGFDVARTDELHESVGSGASLRVVVDASDVAAMVRHGYWVAELRNRLRG